MVETPEILAIIPARGGSKSIPMKNLASLAGQPLIAFSVQVAQQSKLISRTIVSTDSEEIREVSRGLGAEVPFLRPSELAQDDTKDFPVFLHALEWLKTYEGYLPDFVVHLRPTTPLRRAEKIDEAIQLLVDNPSADSVRAVTFPLQNPFKMWTEEAHFMKPLVDLNIPEPYNQPRQNLPRVLWQTGYVDVIARSTLELKHSMTGDYILPFIMEEQNIIDIDQPLSLKIAEFLLKEEVY
ncbi:acylneuraminate cytidylyltransferase family protein [Candidatus Nitronereus thalassa]|uniref:Acylneuraminate cytidylyltransferase family protein n=1 Tax=Candidatus Nitronereus thalassa TaxID=3020898 RepID=A0ABU3K5A5_9BACT|nr:acylneuraminate cytidylyltransferase family protein [Candidatus Nitronereus thalassa]MDT7041540.1 acylneuraminate cytidylyltransferase family protein [Candidatus Nitronereus thalassa]